MIVFTLLYAGLAVIEVGLLRRAVLIGVPDSVDPDPLPTGSAGPPTTVTY